jgi:hypothetical protein
MISFDDPVTQAQLDRLRSEPCTPTGTALTMTSHTLISINRRVRWWRRATRPHWVCITCDLDEPHAKGVCQVACAGMCSYPKCLGEG